MQSKAVKGSVASAFVSRRPAEKNHALRTVETQRQPEKEARSRREKTSSTPWKRSGSQRDSMKMAGSMRRDEMHKDEIGHSRRAEAAGGWEEAAGTRSKEKGTRRAEEESCHVLTSSVST